jgi:hypothetical protein
VSFAVQAALLAATLPALWQGEQRPSMQIARLAFELQSLLVWHSAQTMV